MIKTALKIFLILLISLFLGELLLRFIPSSIQYPQRVQFDNSDGTGVSHAKNIRVKNSSECYGPITYSTNSWGMRDKARSLEKASGVTRVAILGDSMMDAEQVNDEETMSRALEKKFGGQVEFLNFGFNSLGTVQEAILYENKVRQFKPDIVLLMFYTENDVENNSFELEKIVYNQEPFLTYRDAQDRPFNAVSFTFSKAVKQFLNQHFALFRLAKQVNSAIHFRQPSQPAQSSNNSLSQEELLKLREKEGALVRHELFIVPPDQQWEAAWINTAKELRRLKEAVAKDSARFITVITPSVLEFDPTTPQVIADQVFNAVKGERQIDMGYPNRRIAALLAQEQIEFFDLTPPMKEYIKEHNLGSPFFSFSCNGHWSALGHEVAAEELYKYLAPSLLSK